MAKPILILRVPRYVFGEHISSEQLDGLKKNIEKSITDWHILIVVGHVADVQFESHTVDKATDIDIEKLKEICNASLS